MTAPRKKPPIELRDPLDAPRDPHLPPARSTRHHRSFLWWLALAAAALVAYVQMRPRPIVKTVARSVPHTEREAFLAVSFGRISDTIPEALPAATFRDEIVAIKKAGYTPIGLEELEGFFKGGGLPARPILLIFGEAQRETMEIADATLAAEDMRGIFAVNVPGLRDANVDLVSRHRMRQLADSGRWDAILDTSAPAPTSEGAPADPAESYRRERELLERWLDRPVLAIAEQRERFDRTDTEEAWKRAITTVGFHLGFVLAPPRANYVDDSPFLIRSIRVPREWTGQDVVSQLAAREPRRRAFEDRFAGSSPSPAWVIDHGEVGIEDRTLRLASKEGQSGALVWLGGTERWRDASVTVELAAPPTGQFWIGLRAGRGDAFVRLGVAGGRAVLQRASGNGETHEIAARPVPRGPVELTFRMIGGRASASVDGESILERPAEIPRSVGEGWVTLAVWSPQGETAASIRRVEAEPLSPSLALVSASPDEGTWNELRRRVDRLAILSPRQSVMAARDNGDERATLAVEIFARYHHLDLFPALTIDQPLPGAESRRIVDEAARMVAPASVDGLNLVLPRAVAGTREGIELVSSLRSRVAEAKKRLVVTVLGEGSPPASLENVAEVYVADAERPSRLEIADAPLRLVRPGA